ncbi:cellulose biosynthesis cyclic di-GMP-binding regulatory protein BcsB [Acuticoccus yangtzensis]|uniref:cellulose biosynthesis cyclic di-GMP-binding regulatory protein BcsB n=1 Tax=Acuticoccus yangtzensis TaxID=1443441 RepID=UPI00094981F7|nr:cellulose biosynthesis cyclic di-GMP-binding regulatory protein BcsB [Acuticoccus yangtzensis]
MRIQRLLTATALVLVWGVTAATAQSNFSIGGGQASEVPAATSPSQQQSIAAGAARGLGPENPATGAARTGVSPARTQPRPFDVNNDGRTPSAELPDDSPTLSVQPSTTISPLAPGQRASTMPVDAISQEQRDNLVAMLHEQTAQVRELRVMLDEGTDYGAALVDRPIIPERTLRLEGELDSRSWNVYLTAAEAARGGTLSIAFNNSVLVLPESSRLRLTLNGQQIMETAIDSPDRTKVITLPVSSSLLRPGENTFRIESEMRHRIDCSVNATYELWTRIDTRLTGFSAQGLETPVSGLPDIPAIGVGTNGATRLRVIMDQPSNPTQIDRMLKVVQAVAIRGRFRQPLVEIVAPGTDLEPVVGTLNIAMGPAATINRVISDAPSAANIGPTVELVNDEIGPTIVISGPTARDVDSALREFTTLEDAGPMGSTNGPLIDGRTSITLSQLGFDTIDFSGRRFRAGFNVTLPPDFYAAAYGEAQMLLDAAYSESIDPNSQMVIYVNGVSSTSVNFVQADRRRFEQYPIQLGMQSFKPGVNRIELVAELRSVDDTACLPGATAQSDDRFAILSSTRLNFPDFARIGQLPNLASFTADGFPYALRGDPVRVMIGGTALDTVGAAGTLLSRIAIGHGTPLNTNVVDQVEPARDQGLIVVAPMQDVPSQVLQATGTDNVIPSSWDSPLAGGASGVEAQGLEQYDEVLRRLRRQLRQEDAQLNRAATNLGDTDTTSTQRGGSWFDTGEQESTGGISDILRPLRNAFNLNFDFDLNIFGNGTDELTPGSIPDSASLLMVQSVAPDNNSAAWTVVTAPNAGLLSTSIAAVTIPEAWDQISGRAAAFTLETNAVDTVRANKVSYIATLPPSFTNMRLIAANWFSINNGVYAIALVIAAVLLGFVTWLLVRPMGRMN